MDIMVLPFSILSSRGTEWAESGIQLAQFYTPEKSTTWKCNAYFYLFQSTSYFKHLFIFLFVLSFLLFKDLEEDFWKIYQKQIWKEEDIVSIMILVKCP